MENKESVNIPNKRIYDINYETAKFFHSYLMSEDGKWALEYFLHRGLSIDTIKRFKLGVSPASKDSLFKHLKAIGFSDDEMLAAGVVRKNDDFLDIFRNRLMFPIIDVHDMVIAFIGKIEDDGSFPRFLNTCNSPVYTKCDNLFGMNFAQAACTKQILLVEGTMDVISLHQAGFTNAVASLGCNLTKEQAKLLKRYTKEVIIMYDADASGWAGAKNAINLLENEELTVRVLFVPEGKDPDEYIGKNGSESFKQLLSDSANDTVDFSINKYPYNPDFDDEFVIPGITEEVLRFSD